MGNSWTGSGTVSEAFFGAIAWVFSEVAAIEKSGMTDAVFEAFSGAVVLVFSGEIAMEKSDPLVWAVLLEFSRIGRVGRLGKNSLSSAKGSP